MSNDIQVGDVCVFDARVIGAVTSRYVGTECTVLSLAIDTSELFGVRHQCEMFDGVTARIAAIFLRKKPPKQKDDAEPRTDFRPADPDLWELTGFDPSKTRTKETA